MPQATEANDHDRAPLPPRSFLGVFRAELGLIVGVVTTALFFTVGKEWLADLTSLNWLGLMFVWLFGVMIWCAFGVVRHADALAEILGEPYGTLILTLSVISIEVAILATVMLGKTPNPTLPRETMFAILMIVLNGMVGTVLAVGGLRYVQQQYNLQGALAYLAVITPLAFIALVVPTFTESTAGPTLQTQQAIVFGTMTALLYGAFLTIQTTRHRTFFLQPKLARKPSARSRIEAQRSTGAEGQDDAETVLPEPEHHGPAYSGPVHAVLLLATLLPVVLLSKPLATLLDHGIAQVGLPNALGGVVIAMLILSPEWTAALQSAMRDQLQRVNLSLGSALSTIGLTVPVMLAISVITDTPLTLGLNSVDIILLSVTLFVCHITFSGAPPTFSWASCIWCCSGPICS
ncbi:calcium:proton antiporter [Methyloceanibacter methanicus]|uniref:calcium:proton antiporter n=1 Tax=Methyloceanibacter methanicus TaxID=1774968 RepID=UPI001FCD3F53|nr:calcium:proton antiporter [Methyloceanibacter methanicus]